MALAPVAVATRASHRLCASDRHGRLRLSAGAVGRAPAARRRLAGYAEGFVDRYLTGVLYPARLIGLARTVVASAIVASHAGLLVKHRQVIAGRGLAARRSEACDATMTTVVVSRCIAVPGTLLRAHDAAEYERHVWLPGYP